MKRLLLTVMMTLLLVAGCAAPTNVRQPSYDTGIDPDSWALVPAGEFLKDEYLLPTMIDYDYEIMVTPVTNAQYAEYLNEALAEGTIIIDTPDNHFELIESIDTGLGVYGYYPGDPFNGGRHEVEIEEGYRLHMPLDNPDTRIVYNDSTSTFSVISPYENHPVTMITWFGAKAYADFYGYRLPTDDEWQKAARGIDERSYPWGDEISYGNANFYFSRDPFEKGTGKGGDTTPVGFYNGKTYDGFETIDSPSPYGVYDMAGNVWEWTADIYNETADRWLRGGSMRMNEANLRLYVWNSSHPEYYSPSFGFRCVR
jgi:formylglycine-generating enzyme required for sulfatase activity